MIKAIFIIFVLIISQASKAEKNDIDCAQMYQAYIFNAALEEACELDRCVSLEIALIAKSACDSELTESVRYELTEQVLVSSRQDIENHGKIKFCAANKQGYEDLRASIKTCMLTDSKKSKG